VATVIGVSQDRQCKQVKAPRRTALTEHELIEWCKETMAN